MDSNLVTPAVFNTDVSSNQHERKGGMNLTEKGLQVEGMKVTRGFMYNSWVIRSPLTYLASLTMRLRTVAAAVPRLLPRERVHHTPAASCKKRGTTTR